MKNNVYSVKDVKVGFMSSWQATNDGEASRLFEATLKTPGTNIAQHPNDMELWKIGTLDDQTAEFEKDTKYICSGKDFKLDNGLSELDKDTLKKVLDELLKITKEQERERQEFIEIKDKLTAVETKTENNRLGIIDLEKRKKNKWRAK